MFNNFFKTGYIAFFIAIAFMIFSICVFTPILSANSSVQLIAGDSKFYQVSR